LGTVASDVPLHLAVAYHDGTLRWYRDGVLAGSTADVQGNLSAWIDDNSLVFGGDLQGKRIWRGLISHSALYRQALSGDEISRNQFTSRVLHQSRLLADCWENRMPAAGQSLAEANVTEGAWTMRDGTLRAEGQQPVAVLFRNVAGTLVD